MFWQRFVTAICLIPLVLLAIFYASPWILIEILLLVTLVCGWEWQQLVPIKRNIHKFFFMAGLLITIGLADIINVYLIIPGLLVWLLIFFAEITYPASQKYWGHKPIIIGLALLLLSLALQSLIQIYLQPQGQFLLLYTLLIVWAADTGAYIAGKLFGKHKLIPRVSPGKSVEGLVGGFLMVTPVIIIGWMYLKPTIVPWFVIGFLMFIISVIGDLFISMLKRRVNLKDTGVIIPGHGGFLDRLDSLIAVAPVLYAGLIWYLPGI